jgi:hypothetical protein
MMNLLMHEHPIIALASLIGLAEVFRMCSREVSWVLFFTVLLVKSCVNGGISCFHGKFSHFREESSLWA